MMLLIWQFFLILVAALPVCAAIFAVILFHWRKHPRLKDVLNFRRPFWVLFFISVGVVITGLVGGCWIAPFFHFADPKGIMALEFFLLGFAGVFLCSISAIRFFWCLIVAIKHHD